MVSPASNDQLAEDLECPLCLDMYTNSRSLACLHSFCYQCLVRYLDQQKVKDSLICPTCREKTLLPSGQASSLKPNIVVNRLVDTWRSLQQTGLSSENTPTSKRPRYHTDNDGARCEIHTSEFLTQYCKVCKMAICRDCIVSEHRNHEFEELAEAVDKMKQDITWALQVTGPFLPKLQNAQMLITQKARKEISLSETAAALEKEITMAADSALDFVTGAIKRQRDAHLAVLAVLKKVSSGEFVAKTKQNSIATLNLASAVINPQGPPLSCVEIVNVFPELRRKLGYMVDFSIEGGLLDCIGNLNAPSFSPNADLAQRIHFGRLVHPTSWRLFKTFTLPPSRTGEMSSVEVLPDGKLAIGYKSGGIDIFDPLNAGQHKVILPDVKVFDHAVFKDGTFAVVSTARQLNIYTSTGDKLSATFETPATTNRMCVDVDETDELLVGFAEHNAIHVYARSGGSPTKVINLNDFEPWQVTATKMGKIIVKNRNSVKVIDRSGKVKATIYDSPPLCSFGTADTLGNIYVIVLTKTETISVAKYKYDGSLVEYINKEQVVFKINNERYWFGLTALSSNTLAVTDSRSVFIYRNIPMLPDLIKLAK